MRTTKSYKKLSELLIHHRKDIYSIYLFAIFSGIIQLSLPLGVQAIIGFVMGGAFSSSLAILISLVILGVLFAGLMQIQQMKIIEKIQQKIFHYYAFLFNQRIVSVDLKKTDEVYFPELMNRFLDVSTLQKSFSKILLDIPIASIQILLGLIMVSIYNPLFLILVLIMLGIVILIFYITGKKGLETSIKESSNKYDVTGWLEEVARMIHSFKLNKASAYDTKRLDRHVNGYLTYRTKHFKILLFQFKNLVFVKILITSAMLVVGTYLLIHQELNIGQFVAAEIIIITMIGSVEKIIINLDSFYDALTCLDKLETIQEEWYEQNGQTPFQSSGKGMSITLNDVSFGYHPEAPLFKKMNLNIRAGERVAIQGKDGSGKSSLLRLFSTHYTPDSGTILYDNLPLRNYELSSLRSNIGMVFNKPDLFKGSIYENVSFGRSDIHPERIMSLAKILKLDGFINSSPQGLDTQIDTIGKRLSRTLIRKLLLLRALIHEQSLILLEDPFVELEEEVVNHILNYFQTSLKNSTIIVISNDPDHSKIFNQQIQLSENQFIIQS
ncbi:MAG: ABC transporter ATP-binding protein [Chitinophagaceae bacterium]|nr:ABC transporter ATP-binding protein [Chitinophagaceae bacterium]